MSSAGASVPTFVTREQEGAPLTSGTDITGPILPHHPSQPSPLLWRFAPAICVQGEVQITSGGIRNSPAQCLRFIGFARSTRIARAAISLFGAGKTGAEGNGEISRRLVPGSGESGGRPPEIPAVPRPSRIIHAPHPPVFPSPFTASHSQAPKRASLGLLCVEVFAWLFSSPALSASRREKATKQPSSNERSGKRGPQAAIHPGDSCHWAHAFHGTGGIGSAGLQWRGFRGRAKR